MNAMEKHRVTNEFPAPNTPASYIAALQVLKSLSDVPEYSDSYVEDLFCDDDEVMAITDTPQTNGSGCTSVVADYECSNIEVTLLQKHLWKEFFDVGNEMRVSAEGR